MAKKKEAPSQEYFNTQLAMANKLAASRRLIYRLMSRVSSLESWRKKTERSKITARKDPDTVKVTIIAIAFDGTVHPYHFHATKRKPIDWDRIKNELEKDSKAAAVVKINGKAVGIYARSGKDMMPKPGTYDAKTLVPMLIKNILAWKEKQAKPEPKPTWVPKIGDFVCAVRSNQIKTDSLFVVVSMSHINPVFRVRGVLSNILYTFLVCDFRPVTLDDLKKHSKSRSKKCQMKS